MSPVSKFMHRGLLTPEPDATPVVARKSLVDIVELAANGKLDDYLAQHEVPEFKEGDAPKVRKFGERPAFDRATFDIKAYTASIENEFKKN